MLDDVRECEIVNNLHVQHKNSIQKEYKNKQALQKNLQPERFFQKS